jgi:uncharacterized protein
MTLEYFFDQNKKFAVAFSGGVDSSYLLYAAKQAKVEVKGYYVKSEFQPEFELDDARFLAGDYCLDIEVIETNILWDKAIWENSPDRCYHCKSLLLSKIIEKAQADGFTLLCDGTNASDDVNDRPGMKALKDLSVRSPLRECGITKDEVRQLAKDAGLFIWNKPAYACLATRVLTGQALDAILLGKIEECEKKLFGLGFHDFRVRVVGDCARLQLTSADIGMFAKKRDEIAAVLLGQFSDAILDMKNIR